MIEKILAICLVTTSTALITVAWLFIPVLDFLALPIMMLSAIIDYFGWIIIFFEESEFSLLE